LLAPFLVLLLGVVIEVVHLWLARVELENSMEAAALAAVKEWGDANGGLGTSPARDIGVEFAQFNVVNGFPVEIGPNLGMVLANNPNLNKLCDPQKSDMDLTTLPRPDGNLIFGSIIEQPDGTLIFDASLEPSCGCVCDVTVIAEGNQDELHDCGGWRVCFEDCQANALVTKLIIELPPGHKPGAHFDNSIDFSCNVPPIVPSQVIFEPANMPEKVTVCFDPPLNPALFTCNPDNSLLFGLGLQGFGSPQGCPGQGNSADNLPQNNVTVTIVFDVNGELEECSGVFQEGAMTCDQIAIAELSGATGRDFGVRAQSLAFIQPIFCQFAGIDFSPFCVNVVTTARYRCDTGQVELVRIEPENVICAPGLGADP
jgi:hypothetical protein